MIKLPKSLNSWNTDSFAEVFKNEISVMGDSILPLQEALSQGSYANYSKLKIIVLKTSETAENIKIKAGIFYTSTIAGCSCADDPAPDPELSEYCEILCKIAKTNAGGAISLLV